MKEYPLDQLFNGSPEAWATRVKGEQWAAMTSRWRQLGITPEEVKDIALELFSLGREREEYEERLLDAQGLERIISKEGDRPSPGRRPDAEARKERKDYERALARLEARLGRIRAAGRVQPRDLVRAARALKSLTLTAPPLPKLPAHRLGGIWARPRVWRIAAVFFRRRVPRNRIVTELHQALEIIGLGDVVTREMVRRWLRSQELRRWTLAEIEGAQ